MSCLELDAIVDKARRMAEVVDPDLTPFLTNLELLVDCINREARLTPNGATASAGQLVLPLRNRIEVTDWLRRHPEIEKEPIERPLFLTGLPRSGTTYFQYLFDPDPSTRMLRHWEGQRPCPPPGADPESARSRIADSIEAERNTQAGSLHSEIAKIHLTDVEGPEECVAIMDQTFGNVGNYWTYRIPAYFARCLDTVDLRACYAHHKQVLQLLQWQTVPKRWVLKWPCHLVALDELLDVYPDAAFVVTHRDPVQALASNCSLSALLRRATSDPVDPVEIGLQMKDMIGTYLRRLIDFDQRFGAIVRIAHVDYSRAVEIPDVVMTEVFSTLGLDMTPTVQAAIASWRRENPPGKRGTHSYALEDYGLDARHVAEEYAFYTDRFDVPAEGRVDR
jgi:hypothetical protein